MDMAEEIADYLDFLEGIDLINIFNDSEVLNGDAEKFGQLEQFDGLDVVCEEMNASEESEFDFNIEPLNDPAVDILQCIINMIELEHILKSDNKERKTRKKRWGVHPINQLRKEHGHFDNLFAEMLAYDHDKFFNYTRMSPERFDYLLALVESKITKNAPNAIPAKCRLLITLRFLATGDSLKSFHYNFRVGVSTVHNIVYETCQVLYDVLAPEYLKYPTEAEWVKIADEFKDKLRFPNCCGAVDGRHIEIIAPKRSGSKFYNYLNYFSTNLLAISDANKNFIYVDIGGYGSQSDGGVLFHSTFGKRLDSNNLNLPSPTALPYTTTPFPFFIIGDAAFPLKENILTPYSKNGLDKIEFNYNKEHSSVRKVVENIFAIMVKRWRILSGPIHAEPENVDKIVKAVVVLHNFVKHFDDETAIRYMRANRADKEPTIPELRSFYESGFKLNIDNSNAKSHAVRDMYANYLSSIY